MKNNIITLKPLNENHATTPRFFRYAADRIPVLCILLVFAVDLTVYFSVTNPFGICAWALVSLLPKIFIAAWNHHHQHVNTFHQRILNRLLEVVYTFHTGITTNVWVLHHNLGHHRNYLDQASDESGWMKKDGTPMGPLEYTLTIALTGYPRALKVSRSHPKFRGDLFRMGAVNLVLLVAMLVAKPLSATLIFLLPMLLIYLGTCWNTYYHHSGLDTDDHLHASHNIVHPFYNILSGNLGLHTAHHMKQGLHWSKLPELHKEIEEEIPRELIHREFPVVGSWKCWKFLMGSHE